MTLYTDRKPREAVARAIEPGYFKDVPGHNQGQCPDCDYRRHESRQRAAAALNTLRELGFITSEGLDAIHAEEDANGEPRSSVVPGSGR